MATIQLHSNYPCTYACVPNIFIDNYMADANGEFVKVYLYLLRLMHTNGGTVSISAIADYMNHTEKDVMRALKYWEKVGVLQLELDNNKRLTGLCFCDLSANMAIPAISEEPKAGETAKHTPALSPLPASSKTSDIPARREYTLDEIQAFSNNHEISELIFVMESYLKHTLSSTDTNTLLFWYDSLHFSAELIEYLVEYCITNGHSSLRYMDKVAIGWAENGIDNITKAKEHVSIRSKAYYSIMKAFGINGRNLAESEVAFVNRWTKEYAFETELILEACRRTISAIQRPSFEYTETILNNWYTKGVRNLKDIAALDESFSKKKRTTASSTTTTTKKNKFTNFDQRSYDAEALEKMLLTTSV